MLTILMNASNVEWVWPTTNTSFTNCTSLSNYMQLTALVIMNNDLTSLHHLGQPMLNSPPYQSMEWIVQNLFLST